MARSSSPSLPIWRPRKTVIDLYNEKDQIPCYWRIIATLSAFLIMIGFLIIPTTFKAESSTTLSSKAGIILAFVLLVFGYIVSITTFIICRSWLFQLDIILIPCLSSCVLGFLNTLINNHTKHTPQWTVALILSVFSILSYTSGALLTYRRIYMVRARDAMHRHTTGHATALTQETEAQKKQWERLLMQREDAKKAGDGSTFKLDWPGPLDRQSTMDTLRNLPRAARNVYDNRGASVYGRPDLVAQPTAMEPQMDPVQEEEIAVRTETEPLPATAYVPPNYDDQILNTPYTTLQTSSAPTPNPNLPRLEGNGYPLEKPPSEPLDTQHPAQRQYNQYHLVSEDQPSLMQRLAQPEAQGRNLNREISSNRESRRTEIELTERDGTRDEENRADLGDVEVIRRIGRVETDGWGRRHG